MSAPIRIGVIGLGRAFTLMQSAFTHDKRVQLVAAFDPRAVARDAFANMFNAITYTDAEALVASQDVELVYVASPHEFHAEHVILAADAGKHVLVEKPMAISVEESERMVAACARSNVMLLVGHSHRFDAPVQAAQALIQARELGSVRMIQAFNYTDFLYRPRRAAELDAERGGGVVFSQAAHQIDIVRALVGTRLERIRALTGNWDSRRDTEGAYSALLWFSCGATATLTYSGYGTFNSDEWCDQISELGASANPKAFENTHARFAENQSNEAWTKDARGFGGSVASAPIEALENEHFGPLIISCERGAMRVTPKGIWTYTQSGAAFASVRPPAIARQAVIDAIHGALREQQALQHDGRWSAHTVAACEALLRSARTHADVTL
jgi:phthalate 4,5-cis-dihydrodiol dehydrogenase